MVILQDDMLVIKDRETVKWNGSMPTREEEKRATTAYWDGNPFRSVSLTRSISERMKSILYISALVATATAAGCPFMSGELRRRDEGLEKRQSDGSIEGTTLATQAFRAPFELNDTDVYMTTDSGTPIDESVSLKVGPRGPTLLEDFIFRQKIQRFDHERVSVNMLPT
jgi:hypothetical protein